jgi:hypothetical protein
MFVPSAPTIAARAWLSGEVRVTIGAERGYYLRPQSSIFYTSVNAPLRFRRIVFSVRSIKFDCPSFDFLFASRRHFLQTP